MRIREHFNPRAPFEARRGGRLAPASNDRFNPRAPCGARPARFWRTFWSIPISIHAPLAGRDQYFSPSFLRLSLFQPTRPLRGATARARALCMTQIFQPTRPLRGATISLVVHRVLHGISTHAPLAGRDRLSAVARQSHTHFNPRAPCGARLGMDGSQETLPPISTHAPLAGRDRLGRRGDAVREISTHAPLAGRDSKSVQITMHIFAITDKFQMLLHRMPPVRAFCSFLMQENHADFGCEPPKYLCALVLRTIRSSVPRADTSACSRSVRFYSRTSCPSSKIEGCPFLGQ